jgi:RNA polymerase sigma-70 factor (ECF subfamily)
MTDRSNAEWVAALSQPGLQREQAIDDLRRALREGLSYALSRFSDVREADLDDFAQEAVLRVLDKLDTFRGESRFLTWASKVAVHLAYSELRRKRWENIPLQSLEGADSSTVLPDLWIDERAGPEQRALQSSVLETLRQAIAQDLTERQRQALVAVQIQGMPLAEVARRMGSNRNAMYKLMYDARKRLQQALSERGLSSDEILRVFDPETQRA